MSFATTLTEYCLAGIERQEVARGVIVERPGVPDVEAGTYTLDDGTVMEAALLGRGTPEAFTWAWALRDTDLADAVLAPSRRLQGIGETQDIVELRTESVPTPKVALGELGMVAVGLLGYDAFLLNHDSGILLALRSEALALTPLTGEIAVATILAGVENLELEDRATIWPYLRGRGAELRAEHNTWHATLPVGESLELRFDDAGDLLGIRRPAPVAVNGTLTIEREKGHFRDRLRAYELTVDGEEAGRLVAGAELSLELGVGTHDIQLRVDHMTSRTLPVLIREGASTRLICRPGGNARQARKDLTDHRDTYIALDPAPR